jgi:hypothetical protein
MRIWSKEKGLKTSLFNKNTQNFLQDWLYTKGGVKGKISISGGLIRSRTPPLSPNPRIHLSGSFPSIKSV